MSLSQVKLFVMCNILHGFVFFRFHGIGWMDCSVTKCINIYTKFVRVRCTFNKSPLQRDVELVELVELAQKQEAAG